MTKTVVFQPKDPRDEHPLCRERGLLFRGLRHESKDKEGGGGLVRPVQDVRQRGRAQPPRGQGTQGTVLHLQLQRRGRGKSNC
jgi:hypothetical protein